MITSLTEKVAFIEKLFGPGKLARNSKNFDVRCPVCAPKDKTKRKLSIHVDDDMNHCWTCGFRAHTLAPLIRKYVGQSELREYVERFMPQGSRERWLSDPGEPVAKKLELPRNFKLLALTSDHDPDIKAVKRYLFNDRGMSEHDLWYFKLGVSEEYRWKRRVIVPSFDSSGQLNYFVARTIDQNRRPKYDNPDVNKTPIIFNELNIDWTQRLVVCEGAFDLFKCGDNAVPLLGSDLNETSALFNSIIVNNTPIAVALDGDMWTTKVPKMVKKLNEYDINNVVVDVRDFDDPGKMTKKQFAEALGVAKPMTWHTIFSDKLRGASGLSLAL